MLQTPGQTTSGHNPTLFAAVRGSVGVRTPPRWSDRVRSIRVSVSFQQKYPPGSVLRCPTAAKNGGYDQGGCVRGVGWPLRRITSSPSQTLRRRLVRTTDDRRRGVLDACRRSSRLCFSHFATRTVDHTVDLYAAKPDIRPESRFLPILPAFDASVGGVSVRILPCRLVRKN